MISTDFQRVSFSPSQKLLSCHDSYCQPSANNFSVVSKAATANQPISPGCPTSSMRLVQQPVLPTFPPVHHPSNTPFIKVSFTYAHLMTVEQTYNWIRTLGAFRGWKEAPTYAENFRKNSITGKMLPRLNHELLKFELGILDYTHRLELIATVRQLFPSYVELVPRVIPSTPSTLSGMLETDTESDLQVKMIPSPPSLVLRETNAPQAEEYEPCMDYLIKEQDDPVLMDISPQQNFSVKSDSEYSTRSSVKLSSEGSSRGSTAFSLDFSESNFQKLPMARARRSFFVEPNKTLEGVSTNGETLTKSRTATRRSGKSLHGEIVGELYKNKIVTINKIKGRRARIIKKGSANSPVTVGWVSSHTVEGIPLLEQM